ncbi:MAG: FtsX-like permease family protein, partial [Janibacter sp.]|nr:FtsX-like permease family protein [Janibacter sp.]
MTTQTAPAVSTGGTPPALPPSSSKGASWLASWRVALRLARRDVRRHRGRSLAVLLMVGVPTMLICLGLVLGATSQISPQESVPLAMGPAQASVTMTEGRQISQAADPSRGYADKDAPARAIPGARPGGTAEMNAAAIGDLTGGSALPWSEGQSRARIGDRDLGLSTFAVADPAHLPGKITLRSGHWPTRADEVLVSPRGVGRGVPDSGPLQLVVDGDERTVQVVGTALSAQAWGGSHELVTTTPALMDEQPSISGWFVTSTQPITWDDVTRLNEYGLVVHSAHVVAHPPTQDQIDPDLRDMGGSDDTAQLVVLGATLLLITITLLVGPAFAVGATRQRRTLALAASNGATAGQLRRTVLAQALVLGGLSALVGAAVAAPVGWVVVRVITDRGSPLGPFEVPWWQLGAICAIALLAAILAALLPAQRLTRLDIVGAMRGRVVTPPPSRWLFVLGLVVTGLGGAGVIIGLDRSEYVIALAAVLLVLGALLLVPRILHTLGLMAGPLPLPLRLAVRDLARHRTRSAPTVAAVLAGSAALTMGLIGASSDNAQERQDYVPQTLLGEGYVSTDPLSDRDPMAAVARELPGLVLAPVHSYGLPLEDDSAQGGDTVEEPFVITLPHDCTVTEVVDPGAGQEPVGDVEMAPGEVPGARCPDGSSGSGS